MLQVFHTIFTESIPDEHEFHHETEDHEHEDHLQNIDFSVNETDAASAPTEPAPTFLIPPKTTRKEFSDQLETLDGVHAEKLVFQPTPTNFSLPIGFAFFDALTSENSPYFSPLILERPKKVVEVIVPKRRNKPNTIEKVPVQSETNDASDREPENIAATAEDYPFGEKILATLPNLTRNIQHVDDYYDKHSEQPKPKKKKKSGRNLKKKRFKKRKPKNKKKHYYNKNAYYPAESQRITTTIGMTNSRFSDTRKELLPKPGVINHSGYNVAQSYALPSAVLSQSEATQATAATDRKAEVAPARRPVKQRPPPPQELHYFQ